MDTFSNAVLGAVASCALVFAGIVGGAPAANAEGFGGRIQLDAFQESVDVLDDGSEVLVSGFYDSIFRVSVASGEFTEVPVGAATKVVRASPDSQIAYLGRAGSVARLVLSGEQANTVTSETPINGSVTDVAFDDTYAYVTSSTLQGTGGVVTKVEQSTGAVVDSVPVGDKPTSIAIDPVSHHGFTTNELDGTVSDIDLATLEVAHTVALTLANITDVAIDRTHDRLFLADEGGSVEIIRLSTLEVLDNKGLPCDALNVEMADAPTGYRLFVACNTLPRLLRINPADMEIEESLDIRGYAGVAQMAITPDGTRAYIANNDGRSMPFFSLVGSGLSPSIGAAVSTADGFNATITNYDPAFQWSATTTGGGVATVGNDGILRVSGLAPGSDVVATVTTTRTGYTTRSQTKLGHSLTGAPKNPTFNDPVPTPTGFTVQVSNYDPAFSWTTSDNADINDSGLITVDGLLPGGQALVTVSTARTGYNDGFGIVTGTTAIHDGLTPRFGVETQIPSGFSVVIDNFDPNYVWQGSSPDGFVSISNDGVVTAYAHPGRTKTVTVSASRTGYETASASYTGTAGAAPASAPTDVSASPRNGSAIVEWTAPEQYGIFETTGYVVEQATNADGPFVAARGNCAPEATRTSSATSCQATGLQNGATYFFRVASVNVAGDGDPGEPVRVTPRTYAVHVAVPAQVAAGQVVAASVRVTPGGIPSANAAGTARVYRNGALFCEATIRSGSGACSAPIPNQGTQRWSATFTQTEGGDWSSAAITSPASQTVSIDRLAVKPGSCPRKSTLSGFVSVGGSRLVVSVLTRGKWVVVARPTTRTRSWAGAFTVPAAGKTVRATDGRTTTGPLALPGTSCRR